MTKKYADCQNIKTSLVYGWVFFFLSVKFTTSLLALLKDLFGEVFEAEFIYLFCKLFLFTKQTVCVDGY